MKAPSLISESREQELQSFYEGIAPEHLKALWTLPNLLTEEPHTPVRPHVWRWPEVRSHLMRAGELVDTQEAERRVLLLCNPGLDGRPATTQTLVSAFQLVLPGEIARSHRHTPAALRFIVEGEGGYTVVDGEKTFMRPGDFVTTPSWTFHDHGNPTDHPMIWLDGLDVPLIMGLHTMFYEEHQQDTQPVSKAVDDSLHRYGMGVKPTYQQFNGNYSPILNYTYERTREVLTRLAQDGEGSPYDDVVVEYTNPCTGGHALATISAYAQLLRPGRHTQAHRHTSSAVYLAAEGQGCSIVNGERVDWQEHDVFALPMWAWHEHVNASDHEPAVLLSFSDLPVLEALGLYREQEPAIEAAR